MPHVLEENCGVIEWLACEVILHSNLHIMEASLSRIQYIRTWHCYVL